MATNVFELFAKLGLDSSDYESGLGRARSMFSSVGGAIGAGVTALAGATTAAVGAAATGIVNLTSQSVNAYAEYEQMVGGIGKIFGTAGQSLEEFASEFDGTLEEAEAEYERLNEVQSTVLANANDAWRTAGLGVNDYMSTVTTLSGALLGSLENNTELAASYADRAIGDMSDIANTYGYTMDEVSNIYTSVSRGLYQTIDTLTAGQFAGTKSGFEELIDTMAQFTDIQEELGIVVEAGNYEFDNFVNAMSVYNEYMGIAGTTTNEAMTTIQGSLSAFQSTWQNLIAGLGNPDADLGALIDNVVTTALAVVDNITPVAQRAMEGIASLITQLAPILERELPPMIESVVPALLTAVTSIITAVAQALPSIANVLLPQVSSVIQRVLPAILSLIPQFISIGGEIIGAVVQGLLDNAEEITQAGLDVLQEFIYGLVDAAEGDGLTEILDTVMSVLDMIVSFVSENLPILMGVVSEVIASIVSYISQPDNQAMIFDMALTIIEALADGLVRSAPAIVALIPELFANNIMAIEQEAPRLLEAIGLLLGDVALLVFDLIGGMMGMSHDEIIGNIEIIGEYVSQSFDDFITGLTDWITNIGDNISQMWTDIKDWFSGGIDNVMEALGGWWDEISEWFSNLVSNAATWASDMVDNFVGGIRDGISSIGQGMSEFAAEAASYIHFSQPDQGELSNFSEYAPDMVSLWNETLEDAIPNLSIGMGSMSDYIADNMPSLAGADNYAGVVNLPPIVLQNFIGNERIDEVMVNSNQRIDYISGGRA